MRLVFFGSGAFGLPTLQALSGRHEVLCVVSQPDRPAGRGGALTPTPISQWASGHLPAARLLRPERVNTPELVDAIRGFPAEAWVVIAFGQKLGRALLADRFAINLHASRLPRWRGAAPINAAVLAGDAETGNSVITLAERMDAGQVLAQDLRPIAPDQTAGQLHDLLAADGPALVERVLHEHAAGALRPWSQDESRVTIAPKLSKADGWVQFGDTAEACRRRINGLSPWPGVTVRFRGQLLKLLRADIPPSRGPRDSEPGFVMDANAGVLACGEGTALRLIEVQPAGKRSMAWADFARGSRVQPGEQLLGGKPEEGAA